jgi:hypothetical protein
MLSNLTVRSNVIENRHTPQDCKIGGEMGVSPLVRISARDLHELSTLHPIGLGNVFDKETLKTKSSGLPTSEQLSQWESYLFYGDKTVSLAGEGRLSQCWCETVERLLLTWEAIRPQLDLEKALECLCIFVSLKTNVHVKATIHNKFSSEKLELLAEIRKIVESILEEEKRIGISQAYQRASEILGLRD